MTEHDSGGIRQDTGRPDCVICSGRGWIGTLLDGALAAKPCPSCIMVDKQLYGTAFISKGQRIDPTTIKPAR